MFCYPKLVAVLLTAIKRGGQSHPFSNTNLLLIYSLFSVCILLFLQPYWNKNTMVCYYFLLMNSSHSILHLYISSVRSKIHLLITCYFNKLNLSFWPISISLGFDSVSNILVSLSDSSVFSFLFVLSWDHPR